MLASLLAVPLVMMAVGCTDLTGRGPAPLDRTLTGNIEKHPRMGHVYCMRGWLGIFSTGMDELARKIDEELGAPAVSVANEEHFKLREYLVEKHREGRIKEPLVLLGHSYGADDQIRVAQTLEKHGITVDLLVCIDPVTPPPVPANVKRAYCVYRSNPGTDAFPWWRGVPITVVDPLKTPLVNIDLRTAEVGFDTNIHHALIDKVPGIHAMAMAEIAKVCLPRPGVAQRIPPAVVAPAVVVPAGMAPGGGRAN